MALHESAEQLFKGFSKLNRKERFARLMDMGALNDEDVKYLSENQTPAPNLAEKLIENVIGYFQLPLGVATNFCIDGKDYVIPMAVEETSIIAALSKSARWIRHCGSITTEIIGNTVIGQIQIAHVSNLDKLKKCIAINKHFLITSTNPLQ